MRVFGHRITRRCLVRRLHPSFPLSHSATQEQHPRFGNSRAGKKSERRQPRSLRPITEGGSGAGRPMESMSPIPGRQDKASGFIWTLGTVCPRDRQAVSRFWRIPTVLSGIARILPSYISIPRDLLHPKYAPSCSSPPFHAMGKHPKLSTSFPKSRVGPTSACTSALCSLTGAICSVCDTAYCPSNRHGTSGGISICILANYPGDITRSKCRRNWTTAHGRSPQSNPSPYCSPHGSPGQPCCSMA